jgi:hypothetical protein
MTLPAALLGVLISTLFGALFHLWRGGGIGRLILYLILGWAGFWIGHLIGTQFEWTFFSVGPLRLGVAILSSLVFLGIGYWLSLVEVERK